MCYNIKQEQEDIRKLEILNVQNTVAKKIFFGGGFSSFYLFIYFHIFLILFYF